LLKGDQRISEKTELDCKVSLRVGWLGDSIARVKHANHLIVVGRLCSKDFGEMNAKDGRGLLVALKGREKERAF